MCRGLSQQESRQVAIMNMYLKLKRAKVEWNVYHFVIYFWKHVLLKDHPRNRVRQEKKSSPI